MQSSKSSAHSEQANNHTSDNTPRRQEHQQSQTMSTLQRNELKARINNLKVELEVLLRLLARNDVEINNDAVEQMLIRQSQLMDTVLNPK